MTPLPPKAAVATVGFWRAAGPDRWYAQSDAFDARVRRRLGRLRRAAAEGALAGWAGTPVGALGLLILLDQAPRNLFRGATQAFATDRAAQEAATAAVARGFDRRTPWPLRQFFYMPFVHAEDIALQRHAIELFRASGDAESLQWAVLHADIIERFGRFPHRNGAVGRRSSAAELKYLETGGFQG
ncbi:uncharacterized protein (DUF924 family) [Methylopila capsulata]|uniref:Uncharacterized protein (DUF924 family) n=1 Tax=Methylopila capsulata TaxID=61654 RepID=A0A9W6IRI1_9HYPH|nr:DUF924 family protein [Methylopila capsulata]MBM7851172.1 uncharacterized protein (DUF924 family) [Methylopila capsulata]GLK54229.1 hypothetical protein GCM10008170_02480 [Methylopila capsulata]